MTKTVSMRLKDARVNGWISGEQLERELKKSPDVNRLVRVTVPDGV